MRRVAMPVLGFSRWQFPVRYLLNGARTWSYGVFDVETCRVLTAKGQAVHSRFIAQIHHFLIGEPGVALEVGDNEGWLMLLWAILGADGIVDRQEWAQQERERIPNGETQPVTSLPSAVVALPYEGPRSD